MGLRLVLLGPPGSGKGTLARLLQDRLGVVSLSTGELFRQEIHDHTLLGKRVSRYVAAGLLVPDALVVQVMTKQLTSRRLRQGVVLDGFPRTVGQAQGLDQFLTRRRQPLTAAIALRCSPAVLIRRLSGRQICSRCGAIYHVRTMPPRRKGVCDRCNGRLIVRVDDQVATIKRRLAVDRTQAKPLVRYYQRKRLLHHLNGHGSSQAVLARALRLLQHDRA